MTDRVELTWDTVADWFTQIGWKIVATLVVALLARWLLVRLIDRVVTAANARQAQRRAAAREAGAGDAAGTAGTAGAVAAGVATARHVQRMTTMGALLRSTVTVVVSSLTVLTVLATVGVPLAPLLASAGVGGVALGFGAQSLVKDFLSGIFMIVEDQYGVGDSIDTGVAVGTVEDVSLRITRIRDAQGVIWYVRNGEITRIGNRSQGVTTTVAADVPAPAGPTRPGGDA